MKACIGDHATDANFFLVGHPVCGIFIAKHPFLAVAIVRQKPPYVSGQISLGFTNLVSLEVGMLTWPLQPLILPGLE